MQAFLHFCSDHWPFAILMFSMSLSGYALVVWRLLLNYSAGTNMDKFMPQFQETLQQQGVEGALTMCRAESGFIPRRLFAAGLESSSQGIAAMRKAMASVIELDIMPDLNYLLPSILAIAKISTMVGLLGTVFSMIGTFQTLGEAAASGGGGGQAQASREIGLALFATALGLLTAIPLVFCHVLFKAHTHKFEIKMKSSAQKLLVLWQALKSTPAAKQRARSSA